MNTSAILLVAKYAPDPLRMEPHNIGVIVWCAGEMRCRFLGAKEPPPTPASDHSIYKQWVDSWKGLIARDRLEFRAESRFVNRSDPDFVKAVMERSKPQFFASHSAVLGDLDISDIGRTVDQAFERLVYRHKEVLRPSEILEKQCNIVISHSRLADHKYERPIHNLLGNVFGATKYLDVDHAFGDNGGPAVVCKRALPGTNPSANMAALTLHGLKAMNNGELKYRTCSLVTRSTFSPDNEEVQADLEMLRNVSTVIDVSDQQRAVYELEEAVGIRK